MYSYTRAGQVAKKKLRVTRTFSEPYPYPAQTVNADLEASWSYDIEGRVLSVTYPTAMAGVGGAYGSAGGQTYTYTYDSMGRPATMANQAISEQIVTTMSYGPG
jgi:YD repeat-containing protein